MLRNVLLTLAVLTPVILAAEDKIKNGDIPDARSMHAAKSLVRVTKDKKLLCMGILMHPKFVLVPVATVGATLADWQADKLILKLVGEDETVYSRDYYVVALHTVKKEFEMVLVELDSPVPTRKGMALSADINMLTSDALTGLTFIGIKRSKKDRQRILQQLDAEIRWPKTCDDNLVSFDPGREFCVELNDEETSICGNDIGAPIWCENKDGMLYICGINLVDNMYKGKFQCGGSHHAFRSLDDTTIRRIHKVMLLDSYCISDETVLYKLEKQGLTYADFGSFEKEKYRNESVYTDDPYCASANNTCDVHYRNRIIDFYIEGVEKRHVRNMKMHLGLYTGDEVYGYDYERGINFYADSMHPDNWFNYDHFHNTSWTDNGRQNEWVFTLDRWGVYGYVIEFTDRTDGCVIPLVMGVVKTDGHCPWSTMAGPSHAVFTMTYTTQYTSWPLTNYVYADKFTISVSCDSRQWP